MNFEAKFFPGDEDGMVIRIEVPRNVASRIYTDLVDGSSFYLSVDEAVRLRSSINNVLGEVEKSSGN